MSEPRAQLGAEVAALVAQGTQADPAHFEPLALRIFAHQFEHNSVYRDYCVHQGRTPAEVSRWTKIPAFPTDAFKRELVTSFPAEEAVMAQLTSGTSANRRGEIYRDALGRELVFAANEAMTEAYLFPDFAAREAAGLKRCQVLILAPSPQMAPSMGMAMGMEATRVRFGAANSRFLLGHSGIEVDALIACLEAAEASGQPVAFIGGTGAFVYFLKACQRRGLRFQLPAGSRIGDGGGYRGRFGDLDRQAYFDLVQQVLGISDDHCVNVLGMAESATNFFENRLRDSVLGDVVTARRMIPPPWTRTQVVDPQSLDPLPPGEPGLLRHYDLANLPTVLGVQTDNLGQMNADGSFRILGRAQVVEGQVSLQPAERTLGPMGDNRIFRFLETYVNFSIRFKMRFNRRKARSPQPLSMGADCPCGEGIEQLAARTETSSAKEPHQRTDLDY